MLTVFDIDGVELRRYIEKKMLGMKNHFDISDSIEIREVDIAEVACISKSKSSHLSLILDETNPFEIDKCISKNGASVSMVLTLFNCSSGPVVSDQNDSPEDTLDQEVSHPDFLDPDVTFLEISDQDV